MQHRPRGVGPTRRQCIARAGTANESLTVQCSTFVVRMTDTPLAADTFQERASEVSYTWSKGSGCKDTNAIGKRDHSICSRSGLDVRESVTNLAVHRKTDLLGKCMVCVKV